jgi:hypothetical protein
MAQKTLASIVEAVLSYTAGCGLRWPTDMDGSCKDIE